jgi:hypothetical protein
VWKRIFNHIKEGRQRMFQEKHIEQLVYYSIPCQQWLARLMQKFKTNFSSIKGTIIFSESFEVAYFSEKSGICSVNIQYKAYSRDEQGYIPVEGALFKREFTWQFDVV